MFGAVQENLRGTMDDENEDNMLWTHETALQYLYDRGFTLDKDWVWVCHFLHDPSSTDMGAIGYLLGEEDYGGWDFWYNR